jgi:hypothetical protein
VQGCGFSCPDGRWQKGIKSAEQGKGREWLGCLSLLGKVSEDLLTRKVSFRALSNAYPCSYISTAAVYPVVKSTDMGKVLGARYSSTESGETTDSDGLSVGYVL